MVDGMQQALDFYIPALRPHQIETIKRWERNFSSRACRKEFEDIDKEEFFENLKKRFSEENKRLEKFKQFEYLGYKFFVNSYEKDCSCDFGTCGGLPIGISVRWDVHPKQQVRIEKVLDCDTDTLKSQIDVQEIKKIVDKLFNE